MEDHNESTYNYQEWGKCIHKLRRNLHIPILALCADCHISPNTYYRLRAGEINGLAITLTS